MASSRCAWQLDTSKPSGKTCRKRGSCCKKRRRTLNHKGHEGTQRTFGLYSCKLRLRCVVLYEVKRIAQREEDGFQSGKDHPKTVVNTKKDAVVEGPFIRGRTSLHGLIEIARHHHEEAQQQQIETDPEDHPEERADAGKEPRQTVVATAERDEQKRQQHQVGPEPLRRDEVKIVVSQVAGVAVAGKTFLRAFAEQARGHQQRQRENERAA